MPGLTEKMAARFREPPLLSFLYFHRQWLLIQRQLSPLFVHWQTSACAAAPVGELTNNTATARLIAKIIFIVTSPRFWSVRKGDALDRRMLMVTRKAM